MLSWAKAVGDLFSVVIIIFERIFLKVFSTVHWIVIFSHVSLLRSISFWSLFISLFSYYSRLDSCPVTDIKWVLSHIFYTPKCDCRERGKTFSFEYFNSLNPRHIKAFVTFSTSFVLFNWFMFYLLCSFIVGLSCWFYAIYHG